MGHPYFEEIDDIDDPPEPAHDFRWDDDIAVEIWPFGVGSFEVTVTCEVRQAKWWQWWRSDLPFSRRKQMAIYDALKHARTWLRKKDSLRPSYMELKVGFAKSD
jgi:hypothetical protein